MMNEERVAAFIEYAATKGLHIDSVYGHIMHFKQGDLWAYVIDTGILRTVYGDASGPTGSQSSWGPPTADCAVVRMLEHFGMELTDCITADEFESMTEEERLKRITEMMQ